ncbi:MAG: 50S ribosomal protein L25 [Saprospiraceae bacterium]|nr:50S ribosomal protein L25 [Saprospiraceae bacterium]
MQTVAIKAQKRDAFGKKASKDIRKTGMVPAVVYSKEGIEHVVVSPKDLKPLIYTADFKLAEVEIDGASHRAIVKDIQFHPVSDKVVHIDFLKLIDGHPIQCNVPVVFKGVSPGVKTGGKLTQTLRRVNLKTVPEYLVDKIEGDISQMELGSSLRIRDLEVPENIQIMNTPSTPVALVEVPRAAKLNDGEEGDEAEGTEEGATEETAAAE